MNSDSEYEEKYTPPENLEAPSLHLLTDKSKKQYESVYNSFMDWIKQNERGFGFSENDFLDYFTNLSEKYKSTSLCKQYSILKNTLKVNNGVDIDKFLKLRAYLKSKAEGYHAKKAKTFTPEEINEFINDAPDKVFLAIKVALIMSLIGACRVKELHSMKIDNIEDLGSAMLVTIPNSKVKIGRNFTLSGQFYQICKKYAALRPKDATGPSFFLSYQNGKCFATKIGLTKLGTMGKQIAKYLRLPNPELYTGHSFRRSSATLLVDEDGDMAVLKKYDGWKIKSLTRGYVDESMTSKINTSDKSANDTPEISANNTPDRSISNTEKTLANIENANIDFDMSSVSSLTLINCSNLTVNFIIHKSDK